MRDGNDADATISLSVYDLAFGRFQLEFNDFSLEPKSVEQLAMGTIAGIKDGSLSF